MKKILLLCVCLFLGFTLSAQQWNPGNPSGLVYSDEDIHLVLTQRYLHISGLNTADIILYDSLGHPIREWKKLSLDTRDEEVAYRIIYEHVTKEKGWLRINKKDIPTKRKEDEED